MGELVRRPLVRCKQTYELCMHMNLHSLDVKFVSGTDEVIRLQARRIVCATSAGCLNANARWRRYFACGDNSLLKGHAARGWLSILR